MTSANSAPLEPLPVPLPLFAEDGLGNDSDDGVGNGTGPPPGPSVYTMADVEAIALANNPASAIADARVRAQRGRWVQAGLYPNTTIGYVAEEIGADDAAGQQGAFASQKFLLGGKLQLDRQAACWGIEQSQAELITAQTRVLTDARLRFSELLIAQRRVELTAELVRIGERSVETAKKLEEGDQVPPTTVLQAEIEEKSAGILHDQAKIQRDTARRRLAAVMGLSGSCDFTAAGDIDGGAIHFDREAVLAELLAASPELVAADARIAQLRVLVERAFRERIPAPTVSVTARHANAIGDNVAGVSVGFPLPLLDRNQGNIQRAQGELAAACAQRRRLELSLTQQLAQVYGEYDNARRQHDRYRNEILPRAKKSLDLNEAAFAEGQLDYLTLLTSQRTYFETSLQSLDAAEALQRSSALLHGMLLSGSLSGPG